MAVKQRGERNSVLFYKVKHVLLIGSVKKSMHLKKIKVVQCLTLAGPCWVYTSDTETLCSVSWGVIAVLSGVITQAWNMTTGGGSGVTHKAGAVLAERGLYVGGLRKSVDETHLAVQQRAGFHKVVYHFLSADLPVSV